MSTLRIKNGQIEDYTIILSTKDHRHLGQLTGIKSENIEGVFNLNSANELSFSIYKFDFIKPKNYLSDEVYKRYRLIKESIWNQIVDFKLIYIKELDEYYEIHVAIEDAQETYKTITATSACEAELGQLLLDNFEINTDVDMNNKLYDKNFPTVFYRDPTDIESYVDIWNDEEKEKYIVYKLDENGDYELDTNNNKIVDEEATYQKRYDILKQSSLMHRVLKDKAPHYSIEHVDDSLKNIQRVFSTDGTSIYEFLSGEVSEQVNCLFKFNSVKRTISAYDLYTVCLVDGCGYRGDFYDTCPKCGNEDKTLMKYFGTDTTIYVDKNNLTDAIRLETNADNVKNCLKLVAGDELMTSTVRLLNQNGSDYIYYISEFQNNDMPERIKNKLEEYNKKYNEYTTEYQELLLRYYDAIDHIYYLTNSMMPTLEIGEVNSKTEASKLTRDTLSPMALSQITKVTHVDSVNNAVENYAKFLVKSGFVKVKVANNPTPTWVINKNSNGELITDSSGVHTGTWTGAFIVTNYSDEEDITTTDTIEIQINDKYQTFIEQKVFKTLNNNDDEFTVFDILGFELSTEQDMGKFNTEESQKLAQFTDGLQYYCFERLKSFHDAIDGALTVLQSMGITEPTPAINDPKYDITTAGLYERIYEPYYNRLLACTNAMDKIQGVNEYTYVKDGKRYTGCIDSITAIKEESWNRIQAIQRDLNLETFLGEDDYKIFCMYKREDTYNNANYISDGFENAGLIDKAQDFLQIANKELVKAAETQYTISSTLKNFLVIPEFTKIVNCFELGNWIKLKVDGQLFKRLRLISYSVGFGSLDSLSVEFSTVTKNEDLVYDMKQIIQASQSMGGKFDYIAKQAEQGNIAQNNINNWFNEGLDSASIQLKNNEHEEVTYTKNGILCRSYDDTLGQYSPEQLRFTHNMLAYTDNNWETLKTAIGKHQYEEYDDAKNEWVKVKKYGITTEFVEAGHIHGSTMVGGMIYSDNYSNGNNGKAAEGSYIDLIHGYFDFGAGALTLSENGLRINDKAFKDAVENLTTTPDNFSVYASNINVSKGGIKSSQIESLDADKIDWSDADNKVPATNIHEDVVAKTEKLSGQITNRQISDVHADKINWTNATSKVPATNIDTNISVNAENINGDITSDQIVEELNNKKVSGTFSGSFKGSVELSDVTTTSNGRTYLTVSGSFTVGDMELTFVNGLLVDTTSAN